MDVVRIIFIIVVYRFACETVRSVGCLKSGKEQTIMLHYTIVMMSNPFNGYFHSCKWYRSRCSFFLMKYQKYNFHAKHKDFFAK